MLKTKVFQYSFKETTWRICQDWWISFIFFISLGRPHRHCPFILGTLDTLYKLDNLCPFRLWPFRFVAVSVCGRYGLWPFRFVAVSVCGRLGLWPFRFWPFRFVAVMTRNHIPWCCTQHSQVTLHTARLLSHIQVHAQYNIYHPIIPISTANMGKWFAEQIARLMSLSQTGGYSVSSVNMAYIAYRFG